VTAVAVAVLLGGGVAAWLHFKRKPDDKPPEPVVARDTKPDGKKPDGRKSDDDKRDTPTDAAPPFTLTAALDRPEVGAGAGACLTVRAARAAGFTGEIALTLDGLPAGVTAAPQKIAEGQDDAVVALRVAPAAKLGRYPLRAVGAAKGRDKDVVATAELVVVAPFELKVEPGPVVVVQGDRATARVTAVRKGGYDGPVALDWRGLPPGVAATKYQVIPAQETTATVALTAAADAALGSRDDCLVLGTIPDAAGQEPATGRLAVNVTAATVTPAKPPFDLSLDATPVKVAQGGKATVKALVKRGDYTGPIAVELRNLPGKVTADRAVIPAGQGSTDLTLSAAVDAAAGDKADVIAVGTTAEAAPRSVTFGPFIVRVTAPFELAVDPTRVQLAQGGKATLKITATRQGYAGPIDVELRNLPAGVTAPKVTIAKDATTARAELTATGSATVGDKPDVAALGTALDAANRQVLSGPFTVTVAASTPAAFFEYRLDPTPLRLPRGGKSSLRITVMRKDYQGPIAVDLRNLPPGITVTPGLIARGASAVDLGLSAAPDAALGDRTDVVILGTALDAANKVTESPRFTLSVVPGQGIDLAVAAAPYRLKAGGSVTVRVTATRRGYDGPITVELRGLPPLVTAPLGTIAPGAVAVDIQVTADPRAVKGDRPDVRAVGTATALPGQEFPTPAFVVGVLGAPSFTLTVDPGTVALRQGGTAVVRVTAVRKDYDGPIDLALQGLPPGVTAPKVTIPKGQNAADVTLTAAGNATTGDKTDVLASGSAAGAGIANVPSPNFTVSVKAPPTFDLKVETSPLTVRQGGKAKLKVVAVRKGFVGPIAVDVHKLPAHVSAAKAVIPAGRNEVEIEVSAELKAALGDKGDVHVHGVGEGYQTDSPPFTVSVRKP
jgi:hypothetical protein